MKRCARWHCSLLGDIGEAVDEELLCDRAGDLCREVGSFVDGLVAEGIHAVAAGCGGLCSAIPSASKTVVEGYHMYEPDPRLMRKERPTSATGKSVYALFVP